MSDPRIIAVALEDLLQEIGLWSAAAGQTLAAAYYTQRQARETAERAFHRAAVIIDEAQQDEERVTKIISDANAIVDQAETGSSDANATLEQAHEELNDATSTLEFWEDELRKALAWLERAEARLARALDEYERARTAFDQAKWALERAESRYRSCLNNKNRTNCDSEAKTVYLAQEELQRAAYRLQLAEAEVIAAREEVAAARARVQCCSNAVQYATGAVNMAREAESQAEQAVNSVERSFEFAQAAEQNALVAKEKVVEEMAAAEQMLRLSRDAVSTIDAAAIRLADADSAEESAQRYAMGGGHEIEHRLRLLHEIDMADLYASVTGAGIGRVGMVTPRAIAPGINAQSATRGIGHQIANGHSWVKHQRKFSGWDLKTFAQKIDETIQSASGPDVRKLSQGRIAYWNEKEKMVVMRDPKHRDGGSAYRPKDGRAYFDKLRTE